MPCFTFLLLFCKHLICRDPAKGEAVKHCSPEQQDITQGTEEVRGDTLPGLGVGQQSRCSCCICCTETLQGFSLHWPSCGQAAVPCLGFVALSSCHGPCPSNVPCQGTHHPCWGTQAGLGSTASLYMDIQLHQGRALIMRLERETRPG